MMEFRKRPILLIFRFLWIGNGGGPACQNSLSANSLAAC